MTKPLSDDPRPPHEVASESVPRKSFADLGLHALIERNLRLMGFHQPRPIQVEVIEPILQGRDVIGLARAGSGKTVAFVAPLAHLLISHKPAQAQGKSIDPASRLRALVLCPTRELAQQVADEAAAVAQGSVLRTACAYGKVAISPQVQALERGVDLLVATPGRARELIESGALPLASIRHVAIDEADRMLDMGFLPQVQTILRGIPQSRQMVLFSATMPKEVEELAGQFLHDPVRIEVQKHTTTVQHVTQRLIPVHDTDKVAMLLHMLGDGGRPGSGRRGVLVFCRTRRRVGWVGTALERNGISVGMLHGDRSQAQRQKAFDRFANDELRVLVATDVAARGLHVPTVKIVVNYDLPVTPEEYVHRIGRAAHGLEVDRKGDAAGEAFTLLSEDDRLRWRSVVDVTGIEVYAEEMSGFRPTVPMQKGTRAKTDRSKPDVDRAGSNESGRVRGGKLQRRSRKSRPIKKGQKPGKGVVRAVKGEARV